MAEEQRALGLLGAAAIKKNVMIIWHSVCVLRTDQASSWIMYFQVLLLPSVILAHSKYLSFTFKPKETWCILKICFLDTMDLRLMKTHSSQECCFVYRFTLWTCVADVWSLQKNPSPSKSTATTCQMCQKPVHARNKTQKGQESVPQTTQQQLLSFCFTLLFKLVDLA